MTLGIIAQNKFISANENSNHFNYLFLVNPPFISYHGVTSDLVQSITLLT